MNNRHNIVFITSHDTGKHLGCYGAGGMVSPRLDALAASGMRFEHAFCTQSQCSPSRASIVTGRYPHSNGVMGLTHGAFRWDLNADEIHIAQHFRNAGYRTALCGIQHETSRPEQMGFEFIDPRPVAEEVADAAVERLDAWRESEDKTPFYLQIGFFETHRKGGSFEEAFLGYPSVDSAKVAVPGYLVEDDAACDEFAQLGGALLALDTAIGRIIDHIDALELEDDTIIIYTVDHGLPFPRAKTSLYDPGLEVALLIRGPGIAGGQVHDELISNVDLLPTLFDLTGLPTPDNVQGHSFAGLLTGADFQSREAVFAEMTYHNYADPMRCVRTASHKLIVNFMPSAQLYNSTQQWCPRTATVTPSDPKNGTHPLVELYDLRSDPLEQDNLADSSDYAGVRQDLLRRLSEHMRGTDDPLLSGLPLPAMFHDAMRLLRDASAE